MKKYLILFIFIIFLIYIYGGNMEHSVKNFWNGNTFHQANVKIINDSIIKARVNNKWNEYKIIKLPDKFIEWNIDKRKKTLQIIKNGSRPPLDGPHNGIVASYGLKRKDAVFSINNAVKGMGFVPKKDKIKEIIDLLESSIDSSFDKKIETLQYLYDNANEIFDYTKQVSLELYSIPEFETQTFLNEMENPGVAIVFLDIPSYKLKAIAQLLHPEDKELSEYEKNVVYYVNLIHSYFHGHFDREFIAVIYHVVEVFDNSPGKGGKGIRIMP